MVLRRHREMDMRLPFGKGVSDELFLTSARRMDGVLYLPLSISKEGGEVVRQVGVANNRLINVRRTDDGNIDRIGRRLKFNQTYSVMEINDTGGVESRGEAAQRILAGAGIPMKRKVKLDDMEGRNGIELRVYAAPHSYKAGLNFGRRDTIDFLYVQGRAAEDPGFVLITPYMFVFGSKGVWTWMQAGKNVFTPEVETEVISPMQTIAHISGTPSPCEKGDVIKYSMLVGDSISIAFVSTNVRNGVQIDHAASFDYMGDIVLVRA